jgi:superfamily II DNA or RNA helicase
MPHSDYLERQLSRLVRPQIRNAGEFLYDDVLLKQGNQHKVLAQVEDEGSHTVTLSRRSTALWVDCSCPGRRSRAVCPHIWATILAADSKNYLLGTIGDGLSEIKYADDSLEWVSDIRAPASAGLGNRLRYPKPQVPRTPEPDPDPPWKNTLGALQFDRGRNVAWPAGREIYYIVQRSMAVMPTITVQLRMRDRTTSGGWGKLKRDSVEASALPNVEGALDREILATALGSDDGWSYTRSRLNSELRLAGTQAELLLPKMCQTRRCLLQWETPGNENLSECLLWDDGPPWKFRLAFHAAGDAWRLTGYFLRPRDRLEFDQAVVVCKAGLLVTSTAISRLHLDPSLSWIDLLRTHDLIIRKDEGERFLKEFVSQPFVPDIDWPEDLKPQEIRSEPSPIVRIANSSYSWNQNPPMDAVLSFRYGDTETIFGKGPHATYDAPARRILWRDMEKEQQFGAMLTDLGLKYRDDVWQAPGPFWQFSKKKLPAVLSELMSQKWHVEVAGRAFREGGPVEASLSSGIDWFDLDGFMDFGGGQRASIPELLRALELNQRTVDLPDGSIGIIPPDFEAKYGVLAGMGRAEGQAIRFARNSASLLDALLASQEEVKTDEVFARMRENLGRFQGIVPAPQPDGFEGQLRDYQREGLAWMHFLREFGFGGCLADDMGVGKTAQVLALLETRRELRTDEAGGNAPTPSIAVVPRSLIYNWKQEAARFAPQLRVLDYSGAERRDNLRQIAGYDLVLCTYGTMRRDIVELQKLEFDYIILDEAQAIKNRDSDSAKAARLLNGRQKLALSGTPVENHLGELWSLFEFLNPGMLGSSSAFRGGKRSLRNPDEGTRRLLGRAVRPFLLRRTKSQVARELPPKIEQTLYCELPADQRRLYNELRDHYRRQLLGRVEQDGIGKSKIQILKALLRLRQAACHPALLQRGRSDDMSAKLESLLPQLAEISSEGHKTLVFSQFTSFLDIVRKHLDRQQLTYAYLDGQTTDRQAVVERFQNDPECPLFLVSLKAGGVGLNLTAAEYVFLLDPWWNPAVEAQAIDRTHRIGQSNTVFAYRMIARDTVEEKVLELQNRKRDLAASIISEDNRFIGNLQREDLELLLS